MADGLPISYSAFYETGCNKLLNMPSGSCDRNVARIFGIRFAVVTIQFKKLFMDHVQDIMFIFSGMCSILLQSIQSQLEQELDEALFKSNHTGFSDGGLSSPTISDTCTNDICTAFEQLCTTADYRYEDLYIYYMWYLCCGYLSVNS